MTEKDKKKLQKLGFKEKGQNGSFYLCLSNYKIRIATHPPKKEFSSNKLICAYYSDNHFNFNKILNYIDNCILKDLQLLK